MIHKKINLYCYQVIKKGILPGDNCVMTENWKLSGFRWHSESTETSKDQASYKLFKSDGTL